MFELSTTSLDPLVLDLVEWVAREPRAYGDVIEAWRTSCPRLTVWEDAVDRGLVTRERGEHGMIVVATTSGREFLQQHGRA
jgi:hypothetical protein